MSFFNFLENEVLEHVVGKSAYTSPTAYIGLSSTTPAEDATNITEPSTGSYARVATAAGDWNTASGGSIDTQTATTFAQASGDWLAGADLTHLVVFDAVTAGNALFFGSLAVSKPVLSGDTASFPAGDITVTLD